MAEGGKELHAGVVIGGRTTQGFDALANKLEFLGQTVDRIGSAVRGFEEESVQVYRSYEDNMLAAEYALSAQYSSATELAEAMQNLDLYASEWAATTIFHTSDVSKAINEAAHAGWDYTEIVKGIPQAMLIAQAGGMDLSQGLDYLIKMMNTTGTSFDDMSVLIDQWSKASNISATNIEEMGEAFMSLSASAMFADNTQELFTMLAVLANAGVTGSQAGTLIRNAMMRVVAPTDKAKKAMAELGATEEELEGWTGASETAQQLEKLGFSAYDTTTGELKPMRDILVGLHDAISGMTEQGRYDILSTIFPLRSINAATAFYNAIKSGSWDEIFTAIGDSEGYAAKGSEIMMSGLTGAIETLASKWEEFQRSVGESLAPAIEDAAAGLGGIMDAINGMNEEQMAALTGALTTLAGVGPALMGASGVMRFFKSLGLAGTLALFAAMGVGALYNYLQKTSEISFAENFGTIQLDLDSLGEHVDSLKDKFTLQQAAISEWESALEAAETKYATESSRLSELLLQDVLEGKTLTPKDKQKINDYAKSIREATIEGIENAKKSDKSFLQALFGDSKKVPAQDMLNTAEAVVDSYYEGIYSEAYAIGEHLREQMTAALQDDTLDEGERQAIQATVDRLNKINAEIASVLDKEDYYTQLYKAQRVGWDSISGYVAENDAKQTAELAELDTLYGQKWAHYMAAFDYAIENGTEFTDLNGNTRKVTEKDREDISAQIEKAKQDAETSVKNKYADLNFAAIDALMADSDYGNAWKFMRGLTLGADGGFDFAGAFAGKTAEELYQLNEELANLYANAHTIEQRLPIKGDTNSPQYRLLEALLGGSGNAADEAAVWALTLGLNGLSVVPTEAELAAYARDQRIAELQTKLERLYKRRDEAQSWLENWGGDNPDLNNWEGSIVNVDSAFGLTEGHQRTLSETNLQIEEAEAELEKLKAEAAEAVNMQVTAEVDDSAVTSWIPPIKRMRILGIPFAMYAEGGRATTASIFAEGNTAEWAIPEEHSDRTADLLNAARQASGFTWGDLISRYGGLNANTSGRSMVLNYSPTINAQNASGVERVLDADKNRVKRMMKQILDEERTQNEVEVYA